MIRSTKQWKLLSNVDGIDKGQVVEEVPLMSVNSDTTESLRILNRHAPNQTYVVCRHNNNEIILKVGRDVIPYSRGVNHKRIIR